MIVDMTLMDATYVTTHARQSDVDAWTALVFDPGAETMAINRFASAGVKRTLLNADGVPVAIFGFELTQPLTWTAWLIAIEGWERQARAVMRFCRETMKALSKDGAAKRIQAWVLAADVRAVRFAQRLGFEIECLSPALGAGVDFYVMRRVS